MSIKKLILGAATLASLALPGVASAQSYGYGYRDGGYERHYGYRYDYRDGHRQRWEERRRWREIQRRREWERRHRHHWRDHDRYYGY